jgi:alpha-beta hydrolase superfamily lysophospholipase
VEYTFSHGRAAVNPSTTAFLRTIARMMVRLVVATVLLYVVVLVLAWRFQERLAFPAPSGDLPAPAEFGIDDGLVVSVHTADGITLKGWYLPATPTGEPGQRTPGLIWFHGNLETVGSIATVLRDFRPAGVGMLALDYRGYGESGGEATEFGVYRDAEAAWAWMTSRGDIDSTRIAVYGRSIGSAVGLYLATVRSVRAVVLESPFTSGIGMAQEHAGLVPPEMIDLSLDNLERAGRLDAPLLVVHGSDDRLAPVAMGQAIADTGRAEQFLVLEGASHSTTYERGAEEYRRAVHDFLNRHLGISPGSAATRDP